MPIQLRQGEMAFYPQPFVETEPNLLVVTNQRVWQFGDEGQQEIACKDLNHVARVSEHPMRTLAIVLALVGLPLFLVGAYLFLTAGPVPGAPGLGAVPAVPAPVAAAAAGGNDDPAAAADQPADAADAPSGPSDPVAQKITGAVLAVLGALLAGGAFLSFRKEQHLVILRSGEMVMKIRAADKNLQTQIISTVQAAQAGGKASAPKAPAAKPAIKVDDKGDPVKALQELQAQRQAGKIKDEEFQAKREILLERAKNKK